jgi:hypothetical protein
MQFIGLPHQSIKQRIIVCDISVVVTFPQNVNRIVLCAIAKQKLLSNIIFCVDNEASNLLAVGNPVS